MAQADGTVYINTAIEADGMQAGSKQVEAACRRMAKTVNGIGEAAKLSLQKQLDAFTKQNQMYDRQAKKVQEIEDKLKEMSGQKVETEGYKSATKEVERLDAALLKAYDRKERFLETGGNEASRGFQGILHDIEVLETKLRMATAEKERLESSGNAYQSADTSALEEKYLTESQRLEQMHNSLGTSYESLKLKMQSYGAETGKVAQENSVVGDSYESTGEQANVYAMAATRLIAIKQKLWSIAVKVANAIKKGTEALFGFLTNSKRTNKSLGSSIKTILKYTLGIRSLFALLNRMRSAVKEGFENLVQYSDPVNASVSSLKSSLTQLKNSLATAFAPILNVVAPILTTLINLASRAATAVGMLLAVLTGAKSFTRAIAVNEDYAESLKGAGGAAKDAAKEQKKYLSGLDEIRTFTEDSQSGGGGGGGSGINPSDMFENVEIPDKIGNLGKMIEDAWKSVDFSGVGKLVGIKLRDALDSIPWDAIKGRCNRIAQSIGTFINGFVSAPGLWKTVGRTIGEGINTAVGLWNTFFDTVQFVEIGKAISTAANNAMQTIDADGLGRALSQRLRAGLETAYGFVTNFDWQRLGTTVGTAFNSAFRNIDLTMAGETLGTAVMGICDSVINLSKTVNWGELATNISNGINGIFAKFEGSRLGIAANNIMNSLVDSLITAIRTTKWSDMWTDIIDFMVNVNWIEVIGKLIIAAGSLISGLVSGLYDAISATDWNNVWNSIITAFKDFFGIHSPSTLMHDLAVDMMRGLYNGIIEWVTEITKIFSRLQDSIRRKWEEIKTATMDTWNSIKASISQRWAEIQNASLTAIESIKTSITNAWNNLKTTTSTAWNTIKTTVTTVLSGTRSTASTAATGIRTTVTDAWNTIKSNATSTWNSIKTTISSATSSMRSVASSTASSMRSAFTGAFSSIASSAQSAFNKVKSALSSLWDTVKRKAAQIGDTLSNAASGISYSVTPNSAPVMPVPPAPTPKIPYLASGAVIPPRAAFLAVLGDQKNGNNLEMPESLLRRVVREESGGGFSGTLRIPLYINGRQVMEAVLEEAQLKQMISGRNPFEMA